MSEIFFKTNLRYLREQKGNNQSQIAILVGKGHTTIGNWEKGVSEPNLEEIGVLANYFEIDSGDLLFSDLTANDAVTTQSTIAEENSKPDTTLPATAQQLKTMMPRVVTVDNNGNDNIVLVPVRARAGYKTGLADPEFIETLPVYRLPGFTNGIFRMFEVQGLSMYPTFNDKDILVTQFVEKINDLRDDRIYVIVTRNDGILVKRVINRVTKENKLILNSDNYKNREEYPAIVIEPEEVLEVWYAVAYMSRQMRQPAELMNRVIDLEARLSLMEKQYKNPAGSK